MITRESVKKGDHLFEVDVDDDHMLCVIEFVVEKVTPTQAVLKTATYYAGTRQARTAKIGLIRRVDRKTIGYRYHGDKRAALDAFVEREEREIDSRQFEIKRRQHGIKQACDLKATL